MKKGISEYSAKEVMIKPVMVYPTDSVKMVVSKLKKKDTNVVLVVNKKKQFIGEITEMELLKIFVPEQLLDEHMVVGTLGASYDRSFFAKLARDLMTRHDYTTTLKAHLDQLLWLVYTPGFQFIPVLNEKKQVVGVVTPSSILNVLQK
jgi:CBS-domain-containing membrane protein